MKTRRQKARIKICITKGDVKKLRNARKEIKTHIAGITNTFGLGRKIKNLIFHRIVPFLAINKLRLSAYTHTPSGIPKLKFWLSLLIPKLFSYPLEKVKAV